MTARLKVLPRGRRHDTKREAQATFILSFSYFPSLLFFHRGHKKLKPIRENSNATNQIHDQNSNNNSKQTSEPLLNFDNMLAGQEQPSSFTIRRQQPHRPATTAPRRTPATAELYEHPPVVLAMLTGNTMKTCEDAEALLKECRESHSKDRICEVAFNRMALCTNSYYYEQTQHQH